MKIVSRKWAVPVLLVLTVGLFPLCSSMGQRRTEPPDSYDWNVEMTSQEVIFAWLEEQAGEAREFFQEHEELFARIAEAAMGPTADTALTELLAGYDMTYTQMGSGLLQLNYAFTEFPTAIFCDVFFLYDPDFSPGGEYDLGNGWHIQTDYHYMYGL